LKVRDRIVPALLTEAWKEKAGRANKEALDVFASNLSKLLTVPPLVSFWSPSSPKTPQYVCGVDPGFKNGHKIVVLEMLGRGEASVVARDKLYHGSSAATAAAEEKLAALLDQWGVQVVAVGDGVGSLEAQELVGSGECGCALQ
jgi:uncharacterized protein